MANLFFFNITYHLKQQPSKHVVSLFFVLIHSSKQLINKTSSVFVYCKTVTPAFPSGT